MSTLVQSMKRPNLFSSRVAAPARREGKRSFARGLVFALPAAAFLWLLILWML